MSFQQELSFQIGSVNEDVAHLRHPILVFPDGGFIPLPEWDTPRKYLNLMQFTLKDIEGKKPKNASQYLFLFSEDTRVHMEVYEVDLRLDSDIGCLNKLGVPDTHRVLDVVETMFQTHAYIFVENEEGTRIVLDVKPGEIDRTEEIKDAAFPSNYVQIGDQRLFLHGDKLYEIDENTFSYIPCFSIPTRGADRYLFLNRNTLLFLKLDPIKGYTASMAKGVENLPPEYKVEYTDSAQVKRIEDIPQTSIQRVYVPFPEEGLVNVVEVYESEYRLVDTYSM